MIKHALYIYVERGGQIIWLVCCCVKIGSHLIEWCLLRLLYNVQRTTAVFNQSSLQQKTAFFFVIIRSMYTFTNTTVLFFLIKTILAKLARLSRTSDDHHWTKTKGISMKNKISVEKGNLLFFFFWPVQTKHPIHHKNHSSLIQLMWLFLWSFFIFIFANSNLFTCHIHCYP